MQKNIERVAEGRSWLAQAARKIAKTLPLVEIDPGQSIDELILVRFTKKERLNCAFIVSEIDAESPNGFPAMWTDSVSEFELELADIAAYQSVNWVALQVIRVGLPTDFVLKRKRDVASAVQSSHQLLWEYPEDKDWSREFFVRLDIQPAQVGTIPIKFESGKVVPGV